MIKTITPAAAGLDEKHIRRFLASMKRNGVNLHSLLMARGDGLFFEKYWAPFERDTIHRMYSVTKSFVAIAVGCLADEGKLKLSDPIIKYFPDKLPETVHPLLARQTIEDMLTMRTCFVGIYWFQPGVYDRTKFYFGHTPEKVPGTLFDYDSTGSYILGALVERVSGMPLLDYLKLKVLDHIGGFESAQLLKTPDGAPWGDSALVCTSRAMLNFARFVMNKGVWEGKRLLSEEYLTRATSCMTPNALDGATHYDSHGYGYQIWRTDFNGFIFNGMGSQFAICLPDKDFILVCNGDTQLTSAADSPMIFESAFELAAHLDGAEPEYDVDIHAQDELSVARGEAAFPFATAVDGVDYTCEPNPMGITTFRLELHGDECAFVYRNAQGDKRLPFGMKKNWFGKFPQLGYSDEYGNVHDETNGFMLDCAVSGGWLDAKTLQLRVQIIDRYFGILMITFGFTDDGLCTVRMTKCAEDFLDEYNGWMIAAKK